MDLTVLIPIHNEETKLSSQLDAFLESFDCKGGFEVILCENGSTDSTLKMAMDAAAKYPEVEVVVSPRTGIGRALKNGFSHAKGDRIFVTGLDFPFGFAALADSLSVFENGKIIINSKFHSNSKIIVPIGRLVISLVYRLMLFILFGTKIRDPQGSFLVGREEANSILKYCSSQSSFFETQFIIYGQLLGSRIEELPVEFVSPVRSSRFNIPREIIKVTLDIIKELPIFYTNKFKFFFGQLV